MKKKGFHHDHMTNQDITTGSTPHAQHAIKLDSFIAHTSPTPCTYPPQTLLEHSQNVASLIQDFSEDFASKDQVTRIALLHDQGKASKAFINYINSEQATNHNQNFDPNQTQNDNQDSTQQPDKNTTEITNTNSNHHQKVDHSSFGAQTLYKFIDILSAMVVAGHHSGLMDIGSTFSAPGDGTFMGRMKKELTDENDASAFDILSLPEYSNLKTKNDLNPDYVINGDGFTKQQYTRFMFSAQVDADFQDTEKYMTHNTVHRGIHTNPQHLLALLETYIANHFNDNSNKINKERTKIRNTVAQTFENTETGIYDLTAPTGSGKTITLIYSAIKHAIQHNQRRIIYCLPYNSIIDQTGQTFAKIFGRENILLDYYDIDYAKEDLSEDNAHRHMRTTENWDAPIIITSNVQIFESLFANKSTKCRKLHNIANSIIILDEAQSIPRRFLKPCCAALSELIKNYKCSAILSTATQPNFNRVLKSFGVQSKNLYKPDKKAKKTFKRVNIKDIDLLSSDELIDLLRKDHQAICIVNKKSTVTKLREKIEDDPKFLFLSKLQKKADILKTIDEAKRRIDPKVNEPCILISTNLIEAGVDIDFPKGYREKTGLDSVIQTAGRINRNGNRPLNKSTLYVFQFTDIEPPKSLAPYISATNSIIHDGKIDEEDINKYFNRIDVLIRELDGKGIMKSCMEFKFQKVAHDFKMIDDEHIIYIVIPDEKTTQLLNHKNFEELTLHEMRQLKKQSVEILDYELPKLKNNNNVSDLSENMFLLNNPEQYDPTIGLII